MKGAHVVWEIELEEDESNVILSFVMLIQMEDSIPWKRVLGMVCNCYKLNILNVMRGREGLRELQEARNWYEFDGKSEGISLCNDF